MRGIDLSYWDMFLYFGLMLLSLGMWITKFRHLATGLKVLGFTLLVTLTIESYAAFLMVQRKVNLHVYHLLIPLQYAFYAMAFYQTVGGSRERKGILYSIPLYIIAVLLIMFGLQDASQFNSYARLLKDLLLSCCALLYYRDVFTGMSVVRLHKEPMFWASTGLFFYSLGNFFVDGVMNHVLEQSFSLAHTLYYVNVFLGLLLNVTFVISFLLSQRKLFTEWQ